MTNIRFTFKDKINTIDHITFFHDHIVFRAALLGLLHASRPARLIVDLGPGEHVATLAAELQGESLGRVLHLVARADLDAREPELAAWPS